MEKVKTFVIERLAEKSTRLTIITALSGVIGVQFAPGQTEAISLAVASLLGLIATFTKEVK